MEPFIAQVMMFGGNFAPRGWALCDGQLLAISQNDALFSLIGTIYGGDGRTTFALPDLRGRGAMQHGNGPGLSSYSLGQKGGVENITLTQPQLPNHSHTVSGGNVAGDDSNPTTGNGFGSASNDLYVENTPATVMGAGTIKSSGGGGQSHNNMEPFIAVNYIIALVGIYPSRS